MSDGILSLFPFGDPVSGESVSLAIAGDDDPKVMHRDCLRLADVEPEIDAFYCTACGMNGRVSGQWVMEAFETHKADGHP